MEHRFLSSENERLRLRVKTQSRVEAALHVQISQLAEHDDTLRVSLHHILHLQHSANHHRLPDKADNDDAEESLLVLYGLRRWKQEFAVEQTRSLMGRIDALIHEVDRLNGVIGVQNKDK